jgi:hypothetical protein
MHRSTDNLLVLVLALAGCSPAVTASATPVVSPSPSPTAASTAAPTTAPTLSPTPAPSIPPGLRAWPTTFDVAVQGTYWSTPPFRIPFSITIDGPGWFSGHLHAEFVDLQRFDGMAQHQFPNRMLGFADPGRFRGVDGPVDVAGLTPDAALDLLAGRASLTTTNRAAQELFGLTGARVDVHSATSNNPLFGGEEGDFGLGPQLDIRLVVLPLDGRLLVVAVLAAPGDLDGAWDQALPILESVELAG